MIFEWCDCVLLTFSMYKAFLFQAVRLKTSLNFQSINSRQSISRSFLLCANISHFPTSSISILKYVDLNGGALCLLFQY